MKIKGNLVFFRFRQHAKQSHRRKKRKQELISGGAALSYCSNGGDTKEQRVRNRTKLLTFIMTGGSIRHANTRVNINFTVVYIFEPWSINK